MLVLIYYKLLPKLNIFYLSVVTNRVTSSCVYSFLCTLYIITMKMREHEDHRNLLGFLGAFSRSLRALSAISSYVKCVQKANLRMTDDTKRKEKKSNLLGCLQGVFNGKLHFLLQPSDVDLTAVHS